MKIAGSIASSPIVEASHSLIVGTHKLGFGAVASIKLGIKAPMRNKPSPFINPKFPFVSTLNRKPCV